MGNEYAVSCAQSLNIPVGEYDYLEGSAPQNRNEIAVTPKISEMLGAKIGDTVTIDFGTEKIDCIVTAYFQTMNNLGELIRLHDGAPTDMSCVSSIRQIRWTLPTTPLKVKSKAERKKSRSFWMLKM